ncbi:hypothetical protein ACSBR2_036699 [Camellia fascicularis]
MRTTTMATTTFSPPATLERSPWHSPVPYLFGGLAAMLGLIAFALLILACSYWKLSTYLEESRGGGGDRDLEGGEDKSGGSATEALPVLEEKVLVIMAGDVNPTFLATPIFSKAAFFGDDGKGKSENEEREKTKQEVGHHDQTTTTTATMESIEFEETQGNQESQE